MRHFKNGLLGLTVPFFLVACDQKANDPEKALKNVNVIDESNLNDIMLTVADPNEGVSYFQRALANDPERIDLQRGLGLTLIRAGRATEAVVVWSKIVESDEATEEDRLKYADALIRSGDWAKAEATLDKIPPTYETYDRYRLEAMIADSNKEWKKADSFYETALGLTTKPGTVYNNWGYSKLTRGDYPEAEKLFGEAVTYSPSLYTAKNNLVLARAAQGNFTLPILQVTQTEQAQLLHSMALAAIKQGKIDVGKNLLYQAIDTHPQHFDAAVRSLDTLEG